jgi:hypothetical protein
MHLMYITYDLWSAMIDDVIERHSPLFEAMHRAKEGTPISRALVDELEQRGSREIKEDSWQFLLAIDRYEDEIGGFRLVLLSREALEVFQEIREDASAAHGISSAEIRGFEVEHGLDLEEEILLGMEDEYQVSAERTEEGIIFELVVFDSEDIDDNSKLGKYWL